MVLGEADRARGQGELKPQWPSGALADENFFPLAVWLQNPANADEYKKAGINTFVALWNGPTDEQLAELKKHGLRVVCDQNRVGLAHKDDETIIAWMHGDEPDNAQSLGGGKGYGPPILPAKIVEYRQYSKLLGTYIDALPGLVHPRTGRVHASLNQVVAATGFPLVIPDRVPETAPPTAGELDILRRRVDPQGLLRR